MATTYRYDPALEAQLAAIQRGFADATSDARTGVSRLFQDYGIGVEQAQQGFGRAGTQLGWGREDLQRNYQRSLADLNLNRARTGEDYQRAVQSLQRSYQRLQAQQRQQAAGMGVVRGGAMLAAARRRAANQAWDRQPIDTGYQRAMQDFGTAEQRLGEDFRTRMGRLDAQSSWLGQDQGAVLGQLGLRLTRGIGDTVTGLERAARETNQAAIDTAAFRDYYRDLF